MKIITLICITPAFIIFSDYIKKNCLKNSFKKLIYELLVFYYLCNFDAMPVDAHNACNCYKMVFQSVFPINYKYNNNIIKKTIKYDQKYFAVLIIFN